MTATGERIPLARRRAGRERLAERALIYLGATLLALFILVPIYLIAVSAFTPRENAFDFPRSVIPAEVSRSLEVSTRVFWASLMMPGQSARLT